MPYSTNYPTEWSTKFAKMGPATDREFIDVDFTCFDPTTDVIQNGSQYQHAVDYVLMYFRSKEWPYHVLRNVVMNSTDVPLVCPITDLLHTPTPFPAPLAPLVQHLHGVAFNLHNNIWNTNYPLYYPFTSGDENFKARFTISFSNSL